MWLTCNLFTSDCICLYISLQGFILYLYICVCVCVCVCVYKIYWSNHHPAFSRVVLHVELRKKSILVAGGGFTHKFPSTNSLSHTHTHTHTHSHHRVVEGGKKHTVRFGPFWPQSGLMGILWLSAPHSTQSQDVWPPSESIPAGKMNYAEKEKKKKEKNSRAILWGDEGMGWRWWKRNKGVGDKEVTMCFLSVYEVLFSFLLPFFFFRYSVVE